MPEDEDDLDGRRQPVAEAPEAGREAEDGDREDVEDALDEDGPERPRLSEAGLFILSR